VALPPWGPGRRRSRRRGQIGAGGEQVFQLSALRRPLGCHWRHGCRRSRGRAGHLAAGPWGRRSDGHPLHGGHGQRAGRDGWRVVRIEFLGYPFNPPRPSVHGRRWKAMPSQPRFSCSESSAATTASSPPRAWASARRGTRPRPLITLTAFCGNTQTLEIHLRDGRCGMGDLGLRGRMPAVLGLWRQAEGG
jgi:hypothetical protein